MTIALIVFAAFLGAAAATSGIGKLRRMPAVVQMLHSVGVSDAQIRQLAMLEILGALGLFVGIWIPLIGLLAAAGLTLYFLGAVVAHVRAGQSGKELGPAAFLMLIALVTTFLELSR